MEHVEQSLSREKRHCIERTPGVHLIPKIEQALCGKSSKPVRKGEHPSLICNSIGTSPEFSTHVSTLRGLGTRHVVICGFPFNSAVGMTAIEHINQQFEHVYVVLDATRSDPAPSRSPEQMKQALHLLGVELIQMKDFV
jgi:nicotinamidase-related amidase